jgi:hypothetical protein
MVLPKDERLLPKVFALLVVNPTVHVVFVAPATCELPANETLVTLVP